MTHYSLLDFKVASSKNTTSFLTRAECMRDKTWSSVYVYVHREYSPSFGRYLSNKLLFAEHRSGELGIIGFSLEWLARASLPTKPRSGFSQASPRGLGITRKRGTRFIDGWWLWRGDNFVRRVLFSILAEMLVHLPILTTTALIDRLLPLVR